MANKYIATVNKDAAFDITSALRCKKKIVERKTFKCKAILDGSEGNFKFVATYQGIF